MFFIAGKRKPYILHVSAWAISKYALSLSIDLGGFMHMQQGTGCRNCGKPGWRAGRQQPPATYALELWAEGLGERLMQYILLRQTTFLHNPLQPSLVLSTYL